MDLSLGGRSLGIFVVAVVIGFCGYCYCLSVVMLFSSDDRFSSERSSVSYE